MERPISVLRQRTKSFNPEATAFSPVYGSALPQDIALAPSTSATPLQDLDYTLSMAPMFNSSDSPFHDVDSARSLYHRDPLRPAPFRLEDFLSRDVQALVKKLEENPSVREVRAPQTPKREAAQAAEVIRDPTPSLPSFTFPAPDAQSNYTTVNIDELSVGLGLPVAKAAINEDGSPASSHKSRMSQAHPGALYGKLIGWALDKPLTAKGLAEFLQKQDTNDPSTLLSPASVSPARTIVQQKTDTIRPESEAKPHSKTGSLDSHRIAGLTPSKIIADPHGTSAQQHQYRRSSTSSISYRHHSRVPSSRRYPRRHSRTKRMDQGPMPSAADIYPDDAHWTPSAPIYESDDYISYHNQPLQAPEQAQPIISNPFNWPPPAQVYAPEPAPTLADIYAADIDVLALMNELPEPSLCTLAKLGNTHDLRATSAFDLSCEERALTPAQEDGSRYGIRFYGIAYGDQWEMPRTGDFGEIQPFRVRPRDHDGWGSWEWALRKGWGV